MGFVLIVLALTLQCGRPQGCWCCALLSRRRQRRSVSRPRWSIRICYELVDQLRGTLQAPVLPIRNYLDQAEVQAQLATLLGGAS